MLFEALDRESEKLDRVPAEYRVCLYGAHPMMRIVGVMTQPRVIDRILDHLRRSATPA